MGINLTTNFSLQNGLPLDSRNIVNSLSDISTSSRYDGMIVYQKSDKTFYKLINGIFINFNKEINDKLMSLQNITNNKKPSTLNVVDLSNKMSIYKFDATKDIVIQDNLFKILSNGQDTLRATHCNVALYKGELNAKSIEIRIKDVVDTTTANLSPRLVFGTDVDNFVAINLMSFNGYFTKGGVLIQQFTPMYNNGTSQTGFAIGDRFRLTLETNNLQLFKNDVLIASYSNANLYGAGSFTDTSRNFMTAVGKNVYAGIAFRDTDPTKQVTIDYISVEGQATKKYMHISVDDVVVTIKDLFVTNYTSAFEQPFLSFLKSMHDTYGATFSLYLFYTDGTWDLSNVTTKYKYELSLCSDWLKFGFHAFDTNAKYDETGYNATNARTHYNNTITAIEKLAGIDSIDRVPRLGYYTGTLDVCNTLKTNDYTNQYPGILGLLSADDTRNSYYHNDTQKNTLFICDSLVDYSTKLQFFRTDFRLENVSDIYSSLDSYKNDTTKLGNMNSLEIFTHEYLLTEGAGTKQTEFDKIENSCKWARDNKYTFDFAENNLLKVDNVYAPSATALSDMETLNANWSIRPTKTLECIKQGKVVTLHGQLKRGTVPYVNNETLLTLKSGFRPANSVMSVGRTFADSSATDNFSNPTAIIVNADGNVCIGFRGDTINSLHDCVGFSVTFIVP